MSVTVIGSVSVFPGKINFYVCSHEPVTVPTICISQMLGLKCADFAKNTWDDINTFHCDPRPSLKLWQWRAPADSCNIERQNRSHPQAAKTNE